MRSTGIGNMASYYQKSLESTRIKSDLTRLGQELASGQKSDLKRAVGGDLTQFNGIKSALSSLSVYATTAKEAEQFTESVQLSLQAVQQLTEDLAPTLLSAGNSANDSQMRIAASEAEERLEALISALNGQNAGRSMFAGDNVKVPALADANTIITAVTAATAALTTPASIEAEVDNWFDLVGGGFETTGYLGSTTDLEPFRIGPDQTADVNLRADDQTFRDTMKGFVMAALVANGALASDIGARAELLSAAGQRLFAANGDLIETRAEIGVSQNRIEQELVRNAAETGALQSVQVNLTAADPYQTATEIQAAEVQLQSLYTITARLASLNLVNYLR